MKMDDTKRYEAVLRNLAQELLNADECQSFKQVLHHFRVSHSVTTLCQQLKPIINTTQKLLLLVELSSRIPKSLQEDFHRLCVLQFPNYDSYLRIFTNDNSPNEMHKMIAQDSSGRFRIVSQGSEKRIMVKQNNHKQTYEQRSQPGTSVTSGVYSINSDDESDHERINILTENENQGRATPVHLDGKKNVHKLFLNRHNDGTLGFGIKGGKEFGTDIIINVVEEGGPAAIQGLKVGDQILEVNGHSFHDMTHAEAVMSIRNAWNLIILVERPPDIQPIKTNKDFVDYGPSLHPIQELELIVYPSNTGKLGCITQRLPNDTLLVKKVEMNSAAYKAGLIKNDRIIMVDGINVRELSEKQIVMLTNAKRLILKVTRDISIRGDAVDGYILSNKYTVSPAEPKRTVHHQSGINEPRKRRDNSAESNQSSHHSTHYSSGYDKENFRSHSAPNTYLDSPEHLVYGNKLITDTNWVLSSQPTRIHRYTQRKNAHLNRDSYPIHARNSSEGRVIDSSRSRNGNPRREYGTQNGGVSRYVRSRSYSPHRNALAVNQIHKDDHVIQAIQMGLEKRQRAIRQSFYQAPDITDFDWEIN